MGTNDASEVKKISKTSVSRLKRERERRAWTQSEVAERIGTTQITVSRWENGISDPNPYYRQKLGELFGKSIEELDLLPESGEKVLNSSNASDPHASSSHLPLLNVPYRRNPFFTGREEVLVDLYTMLRGRKTAALPLALSGLGGIGKTQIAVEYAYRYHNDYQATFWINATTHTTLSADFMTLAALLDLSEQHEQDQGRVVRAVKRWLVNHTDWLLILDNVDNLTMIIDFLPTYGKGDVLFTTRLQALGTIAQCIEVDKMGPEEGATFLLRRTKALAADASLDQVMEESRIQAVEIVNVLDGLPLALDQAGAYIEETRCGLSEYLNLYTIRRKELLLRRGGFPIDHPDSVAATWSLSFQEVAQKNPAATDLLYLLTFLDPEAIPEEIIFLGATEFGPTLGAVASDPLQVNTLIELLLRYSLIRRFSETKLLSIHHLVQAVLRDGMERGTQIVWAERTIRAVNRTFPNVEPQTWQLRTWQQQTWEKCQRCLPQVQRCVVLSDENSLSFPEAARLFNEAASYLIVSARYQQAELLLLKALAIRQKVPETNRLDMARTLNDLGEVYRYQGKYQEAEPLLREALETRQQMLGEEHPDVAQTVLHQADLHRAQGNYIRAVLLYLQALEIREKVLGSDSPLTAESYYGLARLYYSLEKYQHAETFCERALHIQKRHLGNDHPMIASILSMLAKIYQRQNKFDLAKEINMQALGIREGTSSESHPNIATILNSLAEIYHLEGRYSEAERLIARALEIHKQVLGPEHPFTAYSISNQAENFFLQGDYLQAEKFYRRALVIREQYLGLKHPHTASTYYDLAKLYTALERFEEAELFSSKALSIRKHTFEVNDPAFASVLEKEIALLRRLKRESEARNSRHISKQSEQGALESP